MLMCHGNHFSCSMSHLASCGFDYSHLYTRGWERLNFQPAPERGCWFFVGVDAHGERWFGGYTRIDVTRLCKRLDDLAAALFVKDAKKLVDMDNLPKFGGEEPSNSALLYSWDEASVLGKKMQPRWKWEAPELQYMTSDEEVVGVIRSLRGKGMRSTANHVISEFIQNPELKEALRAPDL